MIPFWSRAEKFPPILVRILARHRSGPPLTDEEISKASGLPLHQVYVISHSIDWGGIDIPTMRRFLVACGADFTSCKDVDRIENYLRHKPTWKYLRKSPAWHTYFAPLLLRYRRSVGSRPHGQ